MHTQKITTRNAAFQRFETLKRNREKRFQQQLAFVEGVHPFEQAILHGWEFEWVGYDGGKRLSGWAQDMLSKMRVDTRMELSGALMAELSDREQPCELIGLVRMRRDGLARMSQAGANPLYVVFDRPQSPGNLGTVIRSADAFGAAGLIVTGHAADPYDPQCIRSSIGTCFALPFQALDGQAQVMAWLEQLPARPQVVGTSAHATQTLSQLDLTGPTLLVIGNETFGMSRAWKECADQMALIPIHGSASSLNAGCAASICLYEVARQRA